MTDIPPTELWFGKAGTLCQTTRKIRIIEQNVPGMSILEPGEVLISLEEFSKKWDKAAEAYDLRWKFIWKTKHVYIATWLEPADSDNVYEKFYQYLMSRVKVCQ